MKLKLQIAEQAKVTKALRRKEIQYHKQLLGMAVIELLCCGGELTQSKRLLAARKLNALDIVDDLFLVILAKKKAPHY